MAAASGSSSGMGGDWGGMGEEGMMIEGWVLKSEILCGGWKYVVGESGVFMREHV